MAKLGVNIDHVATLRAARQGLEPEPVYAALVCEAAGADSIVAHLREDRRHIKERDLFILKEVVKTKLNLEMSTFSDIVNIACKVRPHQATLVPEKRQELTTEGGLNVVSNSRKIRQVAHRLGEKGICVSLFIDPDKAQIDAATKIGIDKIELHTGRYANAASEGEREKLREEIIMAVSYAKDNGMHVFAGHGLDYRNVTGIAGIKDIEELNIGYAIICRAVFTGLRQAVREMKALI